MRPKRLVHMGLVVAALLTICPAAFPWGITAHQFITHRAASLLPAPLEGFFAANMEALVTFSNEPDLLAAADPAEGANHYLDLDEFADAPFDEIPSDQKAFVAKFGEDALGRGRLPWAVEDRYKALVVAFRTKDLSGILREAGHLSHYVGDATMPLHATKNYKGQYSGNVIFDRDTTDRHIHVRFEIEMVDRHRSEIQEAIAARAGQTHEIADPAAAALSLIKRSYLHIDAILAADRALLKPGDEVTQEYYDELYERVGGVAKSQLAIAATEVASFWVSAWREAGEPELPAGEVVIAKPQGGSDNVRNDYQEVEQGDD